MSTRAALGEAIVDGEKIRLTADITGSRISIPEGVSVTLDLNGKTLSRGLNQNNSDPESRGHVIYLLGTLVIEDNSGKITGGFNRGGFGGGIL